MLPLKKKQLLPILLGAPLTLIVILTSIEFPLLSTHPFAILADNLPLVDLKNYVFIFLLFIVIGLGKWAFRKRYGLNSAVVKEQFIEFTQKGSTKKTGLTCTEISIPYRNLNAVDLKPCLDLYMDNPDLIIDCSTEWSIHHDMAVIRVYYFIQDIERSATREKIMNHLMKLASTLSYRIVGGTIQVLSGQELKHAFYNLVNGELLDADPTKSPLLVLSEHGTSAITLFSLEGEEYSQTLLERLMPQYFSLTSRLRTNLFFIINFSRTLSVPKVFTKKKSFSNSKNQTWDTSLYLLLREPNRVRHEELVRTIPQLLSILFRTTQTKIQSKTISPKQLNQVLGRAITRGPLPFNRIPFSSQQVKSLLTPIIMQSSPKQEQKPNLVTDIKNPLIHTYSLNA